MAVPEYIPPKEENNGVQCNNCFVSILLSSIYLFFFAVFGVVSIVIVPFEHNWQRSLMSVIATVFLFATLILPIPAIGFGIHSLFYNIKNINALKNKATAIVVSLVCFVLVVAVACILLWCISAWLHM